MHSFTSDTIEVSCKRLVHVETLLFFWRKCVNTIYTLYIGSGTNGSNTELEKLRICFFTLFWEPFLRSSFQWSFYFLKQHQCYGEAFRGEAGRVGIVQLREEAAQGESYQYLKVRCTKHSTRLFSVVFCARTRANWHKLKHRRFCLYTRSTLLCFWQSTGIDGLGRL